MRQKLVTGAATYGYLVVFGKLGRRRHAHELVRLRRLRGEEGRVVHPGGSKESVVVVAARGSSRVVERRGCAGGGGGLEKRSKWKDEYVVWQSSSAAWKTGLRVLSVRRWPLERVGVAVGGASPFRGGEAAVLLCMDVRAESVEKLEPVSHA